MRLPSVADDRAQVLAVEDHLAAVDALTGVVGETATAAVEALVELYGTVLGRVFDAIGDAGEHDLLAALAHDELVGHVLMAHGALPAPAEMLTERVAPPGEVPVQLTRKPTMTGAR